jgi:hypothetical protein
MKVSCTGQQFPDGDAGPLQENLEYSSCRLVLLLLLLLSLFFFRPPLLSRSLPTGRTAPAPERRNRLEKCTVGAMPAIPSLPPDPVQ